jgi:glutathione S-transferase
MIHFYCGSGSPYAWRVWLALEHKALPYELHMMSFAGGDLRTDAYRAINPRGKVPAIVDGDFRLAESAAIVEYLEDAYPDSGKRLLPSAVQARAAARRMIRDADEYVAHAMEGLVDQLLFTPEQGPDAAAIAKARGHLVDELGALERNADAPFLAGEAGAVDFTLYPMLALSLRMQDRKQPSLGLRETLGPRLTAWMRRVEALPYFDRAYPPHWKST